METFSNKKIDKRKSTIATTSLNRHSWSVSLEESWSCKTHIDWNNLTPLTIPIFHNCFSNLCQSSLSLLTTSSEWRALILAFLVSFGKKILLQFSALIHLQIKLLNYQELYAQNIIFFCVLETSNVKNTVRVSHIGIFIMLNTMGISSISESFSSSTTQFTAASKLPLPKENKR